MFMKQKEIYKENSYPLAGVVMMLVLGGLLFGYDIAVISGAEKGLQAYFIGAEEFVYTDSMHGFTCYSALLGCIVGALLSGLLTSRFGRKGTLATAAVLFFVSVIGSVYPEFPFFQRGIANYPTLVMFNVYRIVGGIGVGLAFAVSMRYVLKEKSSSLRMLLLLCNVLAIVLGLLMVYSVNFLILGDHTDPTFKSLGQGINLVLPGSDPWTVTTGWRYMFGSETVPAALFTLLIFKMDGVKEMKGMMEMKEMKGM
jgi:SP family xylose:H+ symportor-like MFS transporter